VVTVDQVFQAARDRGVRSVRLFIHQPKVNGIGKPVEWTCSLDDLRAFADLVHVKAQTVEGARRMHKVWSIEQWSKVYLNPEPNEQECAFCRAMPTCPSARAKVEREVGAAFNVIAEDGTALTVPTEAASLSRIMDAAPFIEDFTKAVRAEVERRLLSGEPVDNYGLELGRKGDRRWADEKAAESLMRKTFRLKIEEAYELSLKSPTAIERLTRGTKNEDGSAEAPIVGQRQWTKLARLVTQADPKPSVKPLAQIKNPYRPPKPDDSAFQPMPAGDGDIY
jgi:hypothetical protein